MRILHVIPGLEISAGPTTFCVNVCEKIASDDMHLDIVCPNYNNDNCLIPARTKVQLFTEKEWCSNGECPDIMHAHSLWMPFVHKKIQYCLKQKIPYVISTHGMLAPWAMKHKWLKKKLAWWLYQKRDLKKATMFHVTEEREIKWLRDLGFSQPCAIASLGSEIPELHGSKSRSHPTQKKILFLGRIYPIKGLSNLIQAWALLKERAHTKDHKTPKNNIPKNKINQSLFTANGCQWQLVLAGPDQAGHMGELIEQAQKLGLTVENQSTNGGVIRPDEPASPADIVFTGEVFGNKKEQLYYDADIFVLPSFTENFGVVVADALSFACPVITTKGTPWRDLEGSSLSGRCGWWVDIGVEPLFCALKSATCLSDEERKIMGEAGQSLIKRKYSWQTIADDMKAAYEWMLDRRAVPHCVQLD